MTKEDWIKLAMPVSITLLAMAIVTQPMVSDRISIGDSGEAGLWRFLDD